MNNQLNQNIQKLNLPNLVNQIFSDSFYNHFDANHLYPLTNINLQDGNYVVSLAIPGVNKEHVKLSVEKDMLTVMYEIPNKEGAAKPNEAKFLRKEFAVNEFTKKFNIPQNINIEGIKANFENGILTITLPKKEPIVEPVINISIQ